MYFNLFHNWQRGCSIYSVGWEIERSSEIDCRGCSFFFFATVSKYNRRWWKYTSETFEERTNGRRDSAESQKARTLPKSRTRWVWHIGTFFYVSHWFSLTEFAVSFLVVERETRMTKAGTTRSLYDTLFKYLIFTKNETFIINIFTRRIHVYDR